jgi:hypothetical protein
MGRNELPKDKSYKNLTQLVKNHKNPTPPWQAERLKFLSRNREKNETVSEYVAVLKKLAVTCKFSEHEYDNALRDRLMHGIQDNRMQMDMIKVGEDVTFTSALEAAVKCEATYRSVKEMQEVTGGTAKLGASAAGIHHTTGQTRDKHQERKPCWRCNGRNHKEYECKFRSELCFACKQKGHIRSCCPNKKKKQWDKGQKSQEKKGKGYDGKRNKKQHFVDGVDESCDEEPSDDGTLYNYNYNIKAFSDTVPDPVMVDVEFEGQSLRMEIDTGAGYTVIGSEIVESLWPDRRLEPSKLVLETFRR